MSKIQEDTNSPTKKELRAFNLIWAFIFLAVSLIPLIKGHDIIVWPIFVSTAFLLVALTLPKATLPFYTVWVKFGGFIGRVNTKILLGLIFYLIITPIGIVIRIFGRDLLGKKLDFECATYWEDRDIQPGSMKNQF